jgi:hypothetical protein
MTSAAISRGACLATLRLCRRCRIARQRSWYSRLARDNSLNFRQARSERLISLIIGSRWRVFRQRALQVWASLRIELNSASQMRHICFLGVANLRYLRLGIASFCMCHI